MPHAPRRLTRAVALLSVAGMLLAGCSDSDGDGDEAAPPADSRPNIVLLVLDDVGYADLAPFGGEIAVPAIQSLAASGVTITDFHGAPNCSPARAMYLTGVDNHKAGLGNMAETLLPQQVGKEGYEGVLNNRVATVAEILQANDYHTYMTGKWHLGQGEQDPFNRGFDDTFTLLQGLAGHYEVQPAYDGDVTTYTEDGTVVAPPNGTFSVQHDTNQLMSFIDANEADGQPFFAHWAVRMAHDPLQAPTDLIESFKGKYDAGYDVLRTERVERMKQMGLIPQNAETARREPPVRAWDELSPEEKARESREMEVYAAMITAADMEIGRLVDHLHEIGEFDNTQFILMADNGPNGATIDFYGADQINAHYNNSLENVGHHDSFAMYGPGWAQASSGPFRAWKGFETEGGTRTAMIISGTAVAARAGQKADVYADAMDVTPTILGMAGVDHPDVFEGRPILPVQGTSMVPFLNGSQPAVHPSDQAIGAEVWGRAAVRKGDFKLLWVEPPFGSGQWELYNLDTDLAEAHDLSKEQPAKYTEMMADWDKYVQDNGVILALGNGIGG